MRFPLGPTTRQPRGRPIRFVSFGDNSFGDVSDRAVAYQSYRARPDFIVNTGDNVSDNGEEVDALTLTKA